MGARAPELTGIARALGKLDHRRLVVGVAVCAIASVALPDIAGSRFGIATITAELLLVLITVGLGLAIFDLNPVRRPLAPMVIFLALFVIYFMLETVDSLVLGHHILDFYRVNANDGAVVGGALAISAISLVGVYAGYWLVSRRPSTRTAPAPRPPSPWADRSVLVAVTILFAVNTVAAALFVISLGGISRYFNGLSLGLAMVQGPLSHYYPFIAVWGSVAFLICLIHGYGRLPLLLIAALGVLAVVLLQFDPNLTRQNVLGLAISGLVAYTMLRSRGEVFNRRDWQIAVGLAIVLVGYSVGHELYRELTGVNYPTPTAFTDYVHALFEPFRPSQDFIVLTTMFPSRFGFDYGRHFIDIFTFAVPRAIWPAKPLLFGYQWVSYGPLQTTDYETSFTYLGELYTAGGVVGVAVGSVILGGAIGFLERLSRLAEVDRYVLLIYAVLIGVWLPNLVRAGFFDSTVNMVGYAVPIVVMGLLLKDRRRASQLASAIAGFAIAYVWCAGIAIVLAPL